MPRWLTFAIFFAIALLILGGIHFYFYYRLVIVTNLPLPWRTAAKVLFIALPLSFPLSFFIARVMDVSFAKCLLYPIYIWLGVMLMLFFLLLAIDFVQGAAWLGARMAGHKHLIDDPGRRLFLARVIAGGATATVLSAAGYALWHGLGRLAVKRVDVVLPKLPAEMDGFTIAQLTDLHLGSMRSGDWFRRVVERTNSLKPDLIAITGDLADATADRLAGGDVVGELKAPHGVFFVTGNHEYYFDLHGGRAMKTKPLHFILTSIVLGLFLVFAHSCDGSGDNGEENGYLAPVVSLDTSGEGTNLSIVLTTDQAVRDAYVSFLNGDAGPNPVDVVASSQGETLELIFPHVENRTTTTYLGDEHEGVVYFHHYLYLDGGLVTRENTVNEYIGDVTFNQIPQDMNERASVTFSYHRAGSTEKLFDRTIEGDVGFEI